MHELIRGAARLHILHHAAAAPPHGAWMANELAQHGYDISPGTLYPTLHKLADKGLLSVETERVDGHRRKPYGAAAAGRDALSAGSRVLGELAGELLREPPPAAGGRP